MLRDVIIKGLTREDLHKLEDLGDEMLQDTFRRMMILNPLLFFRDLPNHVQEGKRSLTRLEIIQELLKPSTRAFTLYDRARLFSYQISTEDLIQEIREKNSPSVYNEVKSLTFFEDLSSIFSNFRSPIQIMVFQLYPNILPNPDRWVAFYTQYLLSFGIAGSSEKIHDCLVSLEYFFLIGAPIDQPQINDLHFLISNAVLLTATYDSRGNTDYFAILKLIFQKVNPELIPKHTRAFMFEELVLNGRVKQPVSLILLKLMISFLRLTKDDILEMTNVQENNENMKLLFGQATVGSFVGSVPNQRYSLMVDDSESSNVVGGIQSTAVV